MLTEHIAVMDLMALADALLLPDDDLALASVLKSPLFGLDEEQLFALAWNRNGSASRGACGREPAMTPPSRRRRRALDRLAAAGGARRRLPSMPACSVRNSGRKRFLARLGPEATDALDEFLNLALDYEKRETPSLQGFVAWLRAANAEVKRDMEIARDEVRVMTVHGAKGLEAPVVILADTTTPPAGAPQLQPRLLPLPPGAAPGAPGHFVWSVRKDDDVGPMTAARTAVIEAAENEYRRLLYVAMTRAADRLVICGATGERAKPPGCWYDLVHDALAQHALEEDADDGDGKVWRFRKTVSPEDGAGAAGRRGGGSGAASALARAQCAYRSDAVRAAVALECLRREGHGAHRQGRRPAQGAGAWRRRCTGCCSRCRTFRPRHARRPPAGILRGIKEFDADECESMLGQVLALLDDPRFAELFEPGSRAEVPIVGRLAAAGRCRRLRSPARSTGSSSPTMPS